MNETKQGLCALRQPIQRREPVGEVLMASTGQARSGDVSRERMMNQFGIRSCQNHSATRGTILASSKTAHLKRLSRRCSRADSTHIEGVPWPKNTRKRIMNEANQGFCRFIACTNPKA
jgi:hypothetical protein